MNKKKMINILGLIEMLAKSDRTTQKHAQRILDRDITMMMMITDLVFKA
jgi:hypothetical protein